LSFSALTSFARQIDPCTRSSVAYIMKHCFIYWLI